MKVQKTLISASLLMTLGLFLVVAGLTSAASSIGETTKIFIDMPTTEKGFTVRHDNDKFRFAVRDDQLDQEANVYLSNRVLTDRAIQGIELPKDKKVVSDVYSFDILGESHDIGYPNKPFWAGIKFDSDNTRNKEIYYHDSRVGKWVELPSTTNWDEGYVNTYTRLSYSIVVVLEDLEELNVDQGIASWFGAPEMTAAMNKYNFGDKVKVTRVDTGKSIVVTIDDRGPFVPGRIIDLSDDAFAQLAPLSAGVINVKVEKL